MIKKTIFYLLIFITVQSSLFAQNSYEIVRYFNSLTSCSDTNAGMEEFDCVYVEIEYPYFSEVVDNSLNDIIKIFVYQNFFNKPYNNFDTYSKEFFEDYSKTQLEFKTPEWWYTIGIDTVIISPKIIAISFGSYKYMGGAHGVGKIVTLNYEKETGKVLDIDNIFIPDFETTLNSAMNKFIKQKEQNTDFFDYENYSYDNINTRFLIGDNELIFKFDYYDEAYRNGAGDRLSVPFKTIKNIINQDYYYLLK